MIESPFSPKTHLAITGNIGVGKTTLAQKLASAFHWEVLYEAVEGNPYLSDFYADMARWSFHLQVYFLRSRYEQVLTINDLTSSVIQDRTIYEDAHIFARNLHQSGLMSDRDHDNYQGLFELMMSVIKPPDLMIYLQADVPKLEAQIQRRGRSYEKSIAPGYLSNLNGLYEEFARNYREGELLIINVNGLDFANREEDWQLVLSQIEEKLKQIEVL